MSDKHPTRRGDRPARPGAPREPDFAAQMARAEFGRHYVDTGRVEQALEHGEIVFRHKRPDRRRTP